MSAAGHTPGPWHLCTHLQSAEKDAACPCGYRGGIWGSDQEHLICEMGSTVTIGQEGLEPARYPRPTELANARLIVAAPELAVMVRELLSVHEAHHNHPTHAAARRLLSKAGIQP